MDAQRKKVKEAAMAINTENREKMLARIAKMNTAKRLKRIIREFSYQI